MKSAYLQQIIYLIRGESIIFDFDLAILYGVSTKVLKQQVRRNLNRFPSDFMFQLNKNEWKELVTICDQLKKYKNTSSPPFAFSEQGVAMLSSVIRSEKAVQVNIMIMRIFVLIRRSMREDSGLQLKISAIEAELSNHSDQLQLLLNQLDNLSRRSENTESKIGFGFD